MISALSSYLPTGTSFRSTSPLSSDNAKCVIVVSPAGTRYTDAHEIGFDDFEWGVTLFSDDVLQFKKLVYEMRFDEVSARYGEFGSFFVGTILEGEKRSTFFQL